MTLLGREVPELPAEVLFSDLEIEVLKAYSNKKNFTLPKNLGDAVKLVARIGGYLDRKKDPPPGHQLMWLGLPFTHKNSSGLFIRHGLHMTV